VPHGFPESWFRGETILIADITQWIMELMRTHGQLSVFIGVIIEQIIVPIPSPLIVMGAGAILISPGLSIPSAFLQILWIIVLPGTIASTLGSFIGYLISYYGGKALVVRYQRFLGVDWNQIENLEKRFRGKREVLSIFFSRAIPVFPISLVSIFAGLLRIPVRPFTLYTFLGSIFRCFFLAFFGWWIGATYEKVATRLDSVETIVSILMLIGMGVVFAYLFCKFRGTTYGPVKMVVDWIRKKRL
jgi:membrane protein DedA with SNARE-associated domain